jgi:hypothetical protein
LMQVLSVGVTVQTNCADAGWLATVTKNKQEKKTDGVSHEPRGRCSHHMTISPQETTIRVSLCEQDTCGRFVTSNRDILRHPYRKQPGTSAMSALGH